MKCPACDFEGPLAEVRGHVVVQTRVGDEAHVEWCEDHGIALEDDVQASVSAITESLEHDGL